MRAGNTKEAYAEFRKAADLDDHPVRAFSSYNEIIREVAGANGCYLADAEAAFLERSRKYIPDDDLFLDHVHMRSEGAVIVADAVADALVRAGLLPRDKLAAVRDGIASAQKALTAEDEAFARYGAAYEAYRYLHLNERARRLLEQALELHPAFPQANQLLDEIPHSGQRTEYEGQ